MKTYKYAIKSDQNIHKLLLYSLIIFINKAILRDSIIYFKLENRDNEF